MSNNDPETQNSPAPGGLPLRGFAMVLIAVAIGLGLWGLYAVTQGGDGSDSTDTAAGSAESSASAPEDSAEQQPGRSPEAAAPATGDDAAGNDADPAAPSAGDAEPEGDRDAAGDAKGGHAPGEADGADGAAAAPAEPAKLHVLNNSTVPELAADVSQRLDEEGYEVGEVGNFAEEIFPETTVFFTPGNAGSEQEARELASRLGGVARENVDSLPDNTSGAEDITLVLVQDVVL